MDPLAHTIAETCMLARAGRTAVYEAINSGKLVAHKRGARTIIFASDLQRWIESLPQIVVKKPIEHGAVQDTVLSKDRKADRKGRDVGAGKNQALSNVGS